jgi:hypothetical protein
VGSTVQFKIDQLAGTIRFIVQGNLFRWNKGLLEGIRMGNQVNQVNQVNI